MENFIAFNGTRLHFGRGVLNEMAEAASELGSKALVVYGKGSVLKNGSYHDSIAALKKAGIEYVEYSGIKPNPVVSDVDNAARLGKEEKVDMIVAIGGGSVIDSAKIIGICIADEVNGWDIMTGKHIPTTSVPLISVLTLAATGTEMNPTSVVQNPDTGQKIGFRHPVMYAKHSSWTPVIPSAFLQAIQPTALLT